LFLDFLREQPHQEGTLREFSLKTTLTLDHSSEIAERLWFDGMICRGGKPRSWGRNTEEDPFAVPLTLTPFATEVLGDPEGPENWMSGRVFDPYRPQSRLRAALTGTIRSPVSLLFLIAIMTVFAVGWYECFGTWNTAIDYLKPNEANPVVSAVYSGLGMVSGALWYEGHWWSPLQANLVHIGLLHLLMNSLVLWRLGGHVERVYGSLPYFFICLGSAWLGGCAALAWNPFGGAGASAALSGVIAADGVWFLSNRKMLSRRLHYLWGQQVTINLGFMIAISFMAKVSASGHFGGALAGALISWCWLGFSKNIQSVPARIFRSLGMLGAVAVSGLVLVETARANWELWDVYREIEYFRPLTGRLKNELLIPLFRLNSTRISFVLGTPVRLRDPSRVETVLQKLDQYRAISQEQRSEWMSVPRSVRQDLPEKILDLFGAIDEYIIENKSYIQSGRPLDKESRDRLLVALDGMLAQVRLFFLMEDAAANDKKNEKED